MESINSELSPVSALVNSLYRKCWSERPFFPEFSFIRLMAAEWRRKVLAPLQEVLIGSACRLLQNLRFLVEEEARQARCREDSEGLTVLLEK